MLTTSFRGHEDPSLLHRCGRCTAIAAINRDKRSNAIISLRLYLPLCVSCLHSTHSCCLQGDPLEWVSSHRYHHLHTDTPLDPHSPYEGFWWSHMGWLLDNKVGPHMGRDCAFFSAVGRCWVQSPLHKQDDPFWIAAQHGTWFSMCDTELGAPCPCVSAWEAPCGQ